MARTRIPRRHRGPAAGALALWFVCAYGIALASKSFAAGTAAEASAHTGRHLLQAVPPARNCTQRSVETFPPDLFTLKEKQQGAIVIHAIVALWLFAAMAVVCDDYFVASMEVLCDTLHLKPDVAGATFMAGGSSAPELFTSIIGVFFAESDVGISTIVGSAVFNILMIVSLCGLFSTRLVFLSWWPLFRDCSFYCLSVVALILVINDNVVTWYESLIFILMYALYIVVMFFNERLDAAVSRRYPALATGASQKLAGRWDDQERVAILPTAEDRKGGGVTTYSELSLATGTATGDEGEAPESLFAVPQGLVKRIYWLFMLPWSCVFYVTIPDCRRPGVWKKLFFLTFLISVLWIAGMSYLLVWMVCATGDTLGVPDTVMGLTLLAAGTSVPDAMAGVFVAKDGLGDMAVSNSVGSNVFDILVCLGLPWFIKTVLQVPGSTVPISSSGLTYSAITLLSTVIFLLAAVYLNKMKLDRKLGVICLVVYLVVITFSCMYETNVFGLMNPPPCPRTRL